MKKLPLSYREVYCAVKALEAFTGKKMELELVVELSVFLARGEEFQLIVTTSEREQLIKFSEERMMDGASLQDQLLRTPFLVYIEERKESDLTQKLNELFTSELLS